MLKPGDRVAQFVVLREIARGGQGQVVEAQHEQLGSRVAIKVLLDRDAGFERRFAREGQALAQLDHPHLVRVRDCGRLPTGDAYLVMDLVDGQDLRALVREAGPFPIARAVDVLAVVAETLAYCHAHGLTHRDVKPQNILLERETGRPVLVDFGLIRRERAAWKTAAESLTQAGEVLGTPAYMAPEQVDAEAYGPVGPAADVYGLGATLYFLLTGLAPFRGPDAYNVLLALLEQPAPDPRALRPDLPAPLAELCLACLAKQPKDRPPSAQAFADALRSRRERSAPRSRAGLLALGVALGALALVATLPAADPAPPPPGLVEQARQALQDRRLEDALRAADAAIAHAPADAEAWTLRTIALQRARRLPEAAEAAETALRHGPEEPRAWAARGMVRAASGDFADAIEDLLRATELDPSDAGCWTTLAQCHLGAAESDPKQLPRAQAAAERALALDPRQTLALSILADSLRMQGEARRAAPLYEELVAHHDLDGLRRGRYLHLLGHPQAAAQAYEAGLTAVTSPEERVALLGSLGNLLAFDAEPSNDDRALACVEECLAIDPTDARARFTRGELLRRRGELARARADLALVETPPDMALLALLALAQLEGDRGDQDARLEALDRAIERFPLRPEAYTNKANALRDADPAAGLGAVEQALALGLETAPLLAARGELRARLGDPQAGYQDLRRALELAPGDARTRALAAKLACDLDDYAGARDLLRQLPAEPADARLSRELQRLRGIVRAALGSE